MRSMFCWIFALLLVGIMGCDSDGDENGEEGTESSEEGESAEEEAAAQIDAALVGHWAQSSGDIITFNSSGRVHMGSSECVGTYTAIDGMIRTDFDNAGPTCQGVRTSYSIEGDALSYLTNWTRVDAEDDNSI